MCVLVSHVCLNLNYMCVLADMVLVILNACRAGQAFSRPLGLAMSWRLTAPNMMMMMMMST
jgi:hypothetical protein